MNCIVSHGFTYLLIIIILVFCFDNYRQSKLVKFQCVELRYFLWLVLIFQASTLLVFAVLQARWIAESFGQMISAGDALGWIAYDHLNKIFHLTVAVGINSILKYRRRYLERRGK